MKRFHAMRRTRRLVSLLMIMTFIMTCSYYIYKRVLVRRAYQSMQQVVDRKVVFLGDALQHYMTDVRFLFDDKKSALYLAKKNRKDEDKRAFITYIKTFVRNKPYRDVLLFSDEGKVVFALNKKGYNGALFTEQPYKDTALGVAIARVMMTLAPDVGDFTKHFIHGLPSFFILQPLMHNDRFVGICAVEITTEQLFNNNFDSVLLGQSGEIVLGQEQADSVVVVNEPRNRPDLLFKKSMVTGDFIDPLYYAALGKRGTGQVYDYAHVPVIAAWDYSPQTDVGIIAKIDLEEVMSPLYPLLIMCISMFFLVSLSVVYLLYLYGRKEIIKKIRRLIALYMRAYRSMKCILYVVCLSCMILFVGLGFFWLGRVYMNADRAAYHRSKIHVQRVAKTLNNKLYRFMRFTQDLADDVSSGKLTPEQFADQVPVRMHNLSFVHRVTVAYQPFAYKPETRFFAPYWVKKKQGIIRGSVTDYYDYTVENPVGRVSTEWYVHALKQGAHWERPYMSSENGKLIMSYNMPFYTKDDISKTSPIGVVSVAYLVKELGYGIEDAGKTSIVLATLIDTDNYFIYNTRKDLVINRKQIADVLGERQKVAGDTAEQLDQYLALHGGDDAIMHQASIAATGWRLGMSLNRQVLAVPPAQKVINNWIIIVLSCTILLLLLSIALQWQLSKTIMKKLRRGCIAYSLVVCVANFILWGILYQRPWELPLDDVIISDKAVLSNFFDTLRHEAERLNYPKPRMLKTALQIKKIDLSQENKVAFYADIVQKYDDKIHKDAIPAKNEPSVTITDAQKFSFQERHRKQYDDKTVITADVYAELRQEYDYLLYPFNKTHVAFELEYRDETKNIMIVPDFSFYQAAGGRRYSWLDDNLMLSGFTIDGAFFSYESLTAERRLTGGESFKPFVKNLTFNMILQKSLLSVFVTYILPLFVIFISIFAILWVQPQSRIGSYTGLLFTAIVLQRALRQASNISEIVYIEYYFFFIYLALLLFVIHGAYNNWLSRSNRPYDVLFMPYVKLFYWPVQLSAWLLLTAMTFYR